MRGNKERAALSGGDRRAEDQTLLKYSLGIAGRIRDSERVSDDEEQFVVAQRARPRAFRRGTRGTKPARQQRARTPPLLTAAAAPAPNRPPPPVPVGAPAPALQPTVEGPGSDTDDAPLPPADPPARNAGLDERVRSLTSALPSYSLFGILTATPDWGKQVNQARDVIAQVEAALRAGCVSDPHAPACSLSEAKVLANLARLRVERPFSRVDAPAATPMDVGQ